MPRGTWPRWTMTIVVGWFACAALSAAITLLGRRWAPAWLDAWDQQALLNIARGPLSFQNAVLLESPGNLVYMIPLTLSVAIVAIRWRRTVFAATVIAGYVLARPLVILGWTLWNRSRPNLIAAGDASPPLHSFPSGHMVLALSVYGLLAFAWCRRSASLAERSLVVLLTATWCGAAGFARLRLGSHWPSDVIAGAILGTAWLMVLVLAVRHGERVANLIPTQRAIA